MQHRIKVRLRNMYAYHASQRRAGAHAKTKKAQRRAARVALDKGEGFAPSVKRSGQSLRGPVAQLAE